MSAIRATRAAALPPASWKALPFCSEPICDALDVQCSMYSFEINVGYYSIFKAKTEKRKAALSIQVGEGEREGEENKMAITADAQAVCGTGKSLSTLLSLSH